jgi:hypothetical protein
MLAACTGRMFLCAQETVVRTFDIPLRASGRSRELILPRPGPCAACWRTRGSSPESRCWMPAAERAVRTAGRSCARRLSGVDLSAGSWPAKESLYDVLVHGTDGYLRSSDAFDLIISADTLVYFALRFVAAAAGPCDLMACSLRSRTRPAATPSAIGRAARPLQPRPRVCPTAAHQRRTATQIARRAAGGIGNAGRGAQSSESFLNR